MSSTIENDNHSNTNPMVIGLLLLAGGLVLNYVFERHNIFKVWENSRFPISWADMFYPPVCVFLSLTGVVLIVLAILRTTIQRLLQYAFAIAIPLTILYALFAFAMQFFISGADRLGECPGLDGAASSTNVIPESKWTPGQLAVGCGVERRGMFLSYYNDITVYGVTDAAEQQLVLDRVAEHFRQAKTHPVQVVFYDKENVSIRQLQNGATIRTGGPIRLIRVVNIG